MTIRIVNPPAGEAPESVRAAWVGISLPVDGPQHLITCRTVGVCRGPRSLLAGILCILLGRTKIERGYRVRSAVAIDLLCKRAPEAAAWWRENTPHLLKPGGVLIFQEAACEVEQADSAAG
jgi:hypothetical protein